MGSKFVWITCGTPSSLPASDSVSGKFLGQWQWALAKWSTRWRPLHLDPTDPTRPGRIRSIHRVLGEKRSLVLRRGNRLSSDAFFRNQPTNPTRGWFVVPGSTAHPTAKQPIRVKCVGSAPHSFSNVSLFFFGDVFTRAIGSVAVVLSDSLFVVRCVRRSHPSNRPGETGLLPSCLSSLRAALQRYEISISLKGALRRPSPRVRGSVPRFRCRRRSWTSSRSYRPPTPSWSSS